jgi:DNA (cytosine-5)-methyltransferase 1
MLTYLAIAARYQPRWLVWENVPGVYSAKSHVAPDPCPPGGDMDCCDGYEDGQEIVVTDEYEADEDHAFACFLAGLQELGYGFAYRTLDAQYVRTRRFSRAVPQRRRRVFVVGYLGDWRRAAAVLFDRESLSGHPPPRREAGQGIAVCPSLRAQSQSSHRLDSEAFVHVANSGDVGYCLSASAQQSPDAETETLIAVAHSLRREGRDASEDGTGRGTPLVPISFGWQNSASQGLSDSEHIAPTLDKSKTPAVALPWVVRRLTPRECERLMGSPDDFTKIPWRGRPADQCPDGPRYKALGNSWAVNCAEWIGERIAEVDTW